MSRRFFYEINCCDACGRKDEILVCVSRRAWCAYPHRLLNDEYPDWGYETESPFKRPVSSLDDWQDVFRTVSGVLRDEYGGVVEDPVAWVQEVKDSNMMHDIVTFGERYG